MPDLFGAIEAGGTKFVLAAGTGHHNIIATTQIPTTTPEATLSAARDWFRAQGKIAALGISCFGPVELNPAAANWGYITQTTKPGWSDCNVAQFFSAGLECPVGFDTDVNGAALGEYAFGAAAGANVAIYVTVGTGIGGGAVIDGQPVHGARHPEMGHIFVRRHSDDQTFPGACAFHGDCLEGLAAGPAIMARWGASLSELSTDHIGHSIIADYLAQLCVTLLALYAPQVIILGGGVMQTPGLIERIRQGTTSWGKGYFADDPASLIVAPKLGSLSGIAGAFHLAHSAHKTSI
ncbi:MAG: ROK family protein [Parasphingorhabdus sp.]|nr:ROK family protein [Parasphingorhabdus sp.]